MNNADPPHHTAPRKTRMPEARPRRVVRWSIYGLMLSVPLALLICQPGVPRASRSLVDYSTAMDWVQQGKVERVQLQGRSLTLQLTEPQIHEGLSEKTFRTVVPNDDAALLPLLREKGVRIRAEFDEPTSSWPLISAALPWLLMIGLWVFMARRVSSSVGGGFGDARRMVKLGTHRIERSKAPRVTFEDVAGLNSAKRDLMEVVQFLRDPERFKRLGAKVPRGVLLVGPPGTGKTLLARAVAGESEVPFYSISGSEFIELFVGVGAARVRELFAEAKASAPSIVFIDEIDAVGRSRGTGLGGGHDEREQTLNQLLAELDGFARSDLVIVLAATNRPDVLDAALLRPGRFDRRVLVERPEAAARKSMLQVHTRDMPIASDVEIDRIAQETPGFSGADLANLVNEAALHATRRGAQQIEASDFAQAFDKIVLGDPSESRLVPEEKRRIAYHEAGHAIVALHCDGGEPLRRISILPRGMALGATLQSQLNDRHVLTEVNLRARLCVLLGGYACERLCLASGSSGAENDLKEAMKIAERMIAHYGMSKVLGAAHYDTQAEHPFLGQSMASVHAIAPATSNLIDTEVRELMAWALEQARDVITSQRQEVETLVLALLEHETLEGDALNRVIASIAPGSQSRSICVPLETKRKACSAQ